MTDQLEHVVRPVIEGQLKSFCNDHPEIIEAINWYKPRKDKKKTFINSVTKRILNDLLCPQNRERIRNAFRECD